MNLNWMFRMFRGWFQKRSAADIEQLGDRLVSLDRARNQELSRYLSDKHGIRGFVPIVAATAHPAPRSFDPEVLELGDAIAKLGLAQSKALSKYLASKYGLHPLGGGVVIRP